MSVWSRLRKLEDRVAWIEIGKKRAACIHRFQYRTYSENSNPTHLLLHTQEFGWGIVLNCSRCGETKTQPWCDLSKLERQAYKTLNLVPSWWPV